jgi:hypothetical protein
MTSKLDDRFAERHPERSSRSVIHEVVIAQRHPACWSSSLLVILRRR